MARGEEACEPGGQLQRVFVLPLQLLMNRREGLVRGRRCEPAADDSQGERLPAEIAADLCRSAAFRVVGGLAKRTQQVVGVVGLQCA